MDINIPALSDLLTPNETSKILGVTAATLSVWRSTGRYKLPFVKSGRKVLYRPEHIQAFIESRTVKQTQGTL